MYRLGALLLVGIGGWSSATVAADTVPPAPRPPLTGVQITVRICQGEHNLKFWFNAEATEHWNTCKLPVPDVPVFIVSDSGKSGDSKTGKDGIASLPEVVLAPNEKFRMAMACTTHRCFSLHGLFVGDMYIRPGANTFYAETAVRTESGPK